MLKRNKKFYDAYVMELEKTDDEIEQDYKKFSESLKTPETDIPLYEWVILAIHAAQGLGNTVKVVHDAYKLGFMTGKGTK